MSVILKKDWKSTEIIKKTITVLIAKLLSYVAILKKNKDYYAKTLIAIEKHQGRAL